MKEFQSKMARQPKGREKGSATCVSSEKSSSIVSSQSSVFRKPISKSKAEKDALLKSMPKQKRLSKKNGQCKPMTTLQTDIDHKFSTLAEEQINTQMEAPLAVRRPKRRAMNKSDEDSSVKPPYDDSNRKFCQPKKSKDRGWYRVEGITGLRVGKNKNRDQIEVRVKWEGYKETTWEAFSGFVKDTAPMVERYLLKNTFKPFYELQDELKQIKLVEKKQQSEPISQSVKQPCTHPQNSGEQISQIQNLLQHSPPTQITSAKSRKWSETHQVSIKEGLPFNLQCYLAEYFLTNSERQEEWKHILLNVGNRQRRSEDGQLAYQVQALNIASQETVSLFLNREIIDTQNLPEIELALQKQVKLSKEKVQIFIVLAQKTISKKLRKQNGQ